MKKKFLILLSLLFAFVLAFAACDNSSESSSSSSSSASTCTVTFDVNGGDELDEDTKEVAVGERIGTLPKPTKDGYDFIGWYEEDDTDYETKYKSGTKIDSDITLVARWELSSDDKTDDSSSSDGNGGSGGDDAVVCEHNWSTVSRTAATCTADGIRTSKCTKCGERKTETVDVSTGHAYVYTNTDATCTVAAKKITTCEKCDLREEEVTAPATGVHTYLDVWKTTLEPTAYSCGSKYTTCKSCGTKKTSIIEPTLYDTFGMLPIKSLTFSGINVSGDTLSNVTIVNVASTAYAEASSCYRTTLPKNMFDGDTSTYWQSDTLVEKNDYTGDWVTIHLAQKYEVCAVEFVVPNYYAWNLGAGCTVKYDIEVYVDGAWVKAGTLSDTDAQDGVSQNATVTCYLDKAYTTDTIRATVTHATRYAPALIYEAKVYANVGSDNITRTATSIAPLANVSVSGFYNSWTGADSSCLIDGSTSTSWMTDARDWIVYGHYDTNYAISYDSEKSITKIVIKADKLVGETVVIKYLYTDGNSSKYIQLDSFEIKESDSENFEYVIELSDISTKELRFWVSGYGDDEQGYENTINSIEVTASGETTVYDNIEWTLKKTTWAQFEYTEPQFIAYIEWYCSSDAGRKFSLQFWKEDASYPAGGYWEEFGQYTTTGGGSPYKFTVDVGETYEKFRLQILAEPSYWTSYVYEITPYTISEIAIDVPAQDSSVCQHKYAKTNANETVKATCTSSGYSVYQCRSCDYTWKTDATDILAHTWGSASASTDANGNKVSVYNCTACTSGTKTVINEYKTAGGSYVTAPSITSFYHNGNGCWSMTFDDGNYVDTYEWVIPQLQKYNYKATLVATVAYVESYTSNWQRYFATGTFDLGSHSYAHGAIYASALNESALMDDVNRAHFKLLNMFPGQRLLGFATPNGTTSNDTAHFVTDIMGAGRNGSALNGGMTDISTLTTRGAWGNLNSYISKSDQTEGTYEYVKKNSIVTNYVYSESANKLTNQPNLTGTYYYVADEWRYEWRESGSYNKVGNEYVYVDDNSGEYVLAHTVLGSYEKAIDTLVSGKYWTVECIHSLGAGDIYSTYDSTISKFEYLKKTGVWVGSYTEAIQYIKESQSATVENMSATSSQISFTLTDSLDDYMFNHALTLTLELPAGWTDVTVTQNGVEIPMCNAEEYNPNMEEELVCAIIDGTLYLDAIPDGGEIVITKK